jgi:uncharacterized protein YggE
MEDNTKGLLESPRVAQAAFVFLCIAVAFLAVSMIGELQHFGEPSAAQNVITVSGEGKVSAPPDIATINFTVSEDASTAADAQDAAAKKLNAALAALKDQKIADADIQTSSYNVYPKYSSAQPCVYNTTVNGLIVPCPQTEQKIVGYTASQTVTVKVRNVDAVGDVVTALGGAGISNLNGPSFTIDNPDKLQADARAKAIEDARTKADALAKDLGVRIVRVTNYSENGGGYPVPMYMKAEASGAADARTVPQVPTGENDVTVDVSVTYEIR